MASLGEQTVGSIVKLNVNGTAREFIVVHQGLPGTMYDASCDGTWLLMKDIYENRKWDSTNNDYENSDIHEYLNSTFFGMFDSEIQDIIKRVNIPYRPGSGNSSTVSGISDGLSAMVFLLSFAELSYNMSVNAPVEGAELDYFKDTESSQRIAYYNGTAGNWWMRSPRINNNRVWYTGVEGTGYGAQWTNSLGIRPAVIFPSNTKVSGDGTIITTLKGIAGQVPIVGILHNLTGEGYININGILRPLVNSYANVDGVLCSLKGGANLADLPTGYTQYGYIGSSGTQYIDTGLTVNKTDSYEYILSAYFTNDAYGGANGYMQFNSGISRYTLTEFRIVYNGSTGVENIYVNGSLHTTTDWTSTYNGTDVKIGIFKLGDTGNVWHSLEAQIGKVYSCQIYKSGTLVRDFVPCTNPSGVAGLYDLVGGAFYGNAGTGTFGTGT